MLLLWLAALFLITITTVVIMNSSQAVPDYQIPTSRNEQDDPNVPDPIITSFNSNPNRLSPRGGTVQLNAVFSGTGVITTIPGSMITRTIQSGIPEDFTIFSTTTFLLTVKNSNAETVDDFLQVTVDPPDPIIESFQPSSGALPVGGGTVTLTPKFSGERDAIIIFPGSDNIPVTSGVGVDIPITSTTTFTLSVRNSIGATVSSSTTVTVATASLPIDSSNLNLVP
jgi:hypothetical protein